MVLIGRASSMEIQQKHIPQLRFPEFLNDGEWEVKRWGEIAESFTGLTYSPEQVVENGGTLVLRSSNIKNGVLSFEDNVYVQMDIPERAITHIGDLLICVRNGSKNLIGKSAVITKEAENTAFGAFMTVLRAKEGTDQEFLNFLWQSDMIQNQILRNLGSTINQITSKDLNGYKVIVPPLAEQRRIAACLSALDEMLAATNEKLEQMKAYKKGLMQQLFVDSMGGGGKSLKINHLQIPKLRFPEFYEEKEWIYYNGDKMFEPIVNKNHNSDLPVLAITQDQGAIPRDLIDYNVIVSDKSIEAYKVVEIGDFIISLRSFQGGIEYSKFKGLCSPAYIVLRKKSDDVCDDFYRYYFKSNQYIKDLNRNLEGIRDGKMVSYKQFSDIMIPCPKYEEQWKIASCLSAMDETINAYTEKVGLLGQYKKGLMQQMFPQNQMN